VSKIVNLRRVRKEKARDAKKKDADDNRIKHGVAKRERSLSETQNAKIARDLDAHKLKDK
jgi:hypothetical protein